MEIFTTGQQGDMYSYTALEGVNDSSSKSEDLAGELDPS